jgi:aspartate kinase
VFRRWRRKQSGGDGRLHRATEDGVTTTLGRGGSDFTASIVGAGIGAEEIQIWTDVDGMLTADPTILPGGHRVKTISFAEAAELAYFGAKVLHPGHRDSGHRAQHPGADSEFAPARRAGTRIVASRACGNVVKSIACKRKITLVNIHSTRMLMAHGFLRRIFEVFDRTKRRSIWWRPAKSACRSPSTTPRWSAICAS